MAIKKFAGIVEGDVFTIITLDTEFQGSDGVTGDRLVAGFLSEPKFIEIPSDSEVNPYWTWDGNQFVPPSI
jgi:hypothetical protein